MTWSIFFYQKLRKGCPMRYVKFQHGSLHSSRCIAKKKHRGGIHSPPPARARGVDAWHHRALLRAATPSSSSIGLQSDNENAQSEYVGVLLTQPCAHRYTWVACPSKTAKPSFGGGISPSAATVSNGCGSTALL